jgi:hypothetical protein
VIPEASEELYIHYRSYPIPGGLIGRPVVNVLFRLGENVTSFPILVDCGADEIVIPRRLLIPLEVDESESASDIPARGIYGSMDRLITPEIRLEFPDYWIEWGFEAHLVASSAIDTFQYGLLGREPTLDYFRITLGHELGYGFQMEPRR